MGGIYEGPFGEELHGDGREVEPPAEGEKCIIGCTGNEHRQFPCMSNPCMCHCHGPIGKVVTAQQPVCTKLHNAALCIEVHKQWIIDESLREGLWNFLNRRFDGDRLLKHQQHFMRELNNLKPVAQACAGLRAERDDPEWDGTDTAHPAWWRGHDSSCQQFCREINEILDGKPMGGTCREPWEATRWRVFNLLMLAAKLTTERDDLKRQLELQQQECSTIRRNYLHEKCEREKAESDNQELRARLEAVQPYLGHSDNCPHAYVDSMGKPCKCGLAEAIGATQGQAGEEKA